MTELNTVYVVLGLLVTMIVIGALLPRYLPQLVRVLDSTVLKDEKSGRGGPDSH